MRTDRTLASLLSVFSKHNMGHFLPRNGSLGVNRSGNQCVNLWNWWLVELGIPCMAGNAGDFVGTDLKPTNLKRGYRWIRNRPWNKPSPGDGVVFLGAETGGFGHVAVCLTSGVYGLHTLDQNWPEGSPVTHVKHDYGSVQGWLHILPRG